MKNKIGIFNYIDLLSLKDEDKSKLREYCLEYCFSWLPIGIKQREPYKQLLDKKTLNNYLEQGKKIAEKSMISQMKSDFYKKEMNNIFTKTRTDGEIEILKNKITENDNQIVLALQIIRSDVWSNRLSSIWAVIISILSLVVSLVSISLSLSISITLS
jgi:hypothetical protein